MIHSCQMCLNSLTQTADINWTPSLVLESTWSRVRIIWALEVTCRWDVLYCSHFDKRAYPWEGFKKNGGGGLRKKADVLSFWLFLTILIAQLALSLNDGGSPHSCIEYLRIVASCWRPNVLNIVINCRVDLLSWWFNKRMKDWGKTSQFCCS